MSEYRSTYSVAGGIANLVAALGYILLIGGFLFLMINVLAFANNKQANSPEGALAFLGFLNSLAAFVTGILLIGMGQFLRATVDIADFTGEILSLMKQNVPASQARNHPPMENSRAKARHAELSTIPQKNDEAL